MDRAEKELWWEMYDDEFSVSNKMSPCRQSFYKDEFMEVVDSPDMAKMAYIKDNIIATVCLLSSNLSHFPWLSKDYFEAHYNDDFQNNNILYFISLLTKNEFRRQNFASETINFMTELLKLDESEPIILFDCTKNNAMFLPDMIEAVVHDTGQAKIELSKIGEQHYFAGKLALNYLREDRK